MGSRSLWERPDPPGVGELLSEGGVWGAGGGDCRRRGALGGGGDRRRLDGRSRADRDGRWAGAPEGSARGGSEPAAGERVSSRQGRGRGAGMQAWSKAVVFLVVALSLAGWSRADCPLNDVSGMQCSLGTQFLTWDRYYSSAGLCVDGSCRCVPPFAGPACDKLSSAAAPAYFTAAKGMDPTFALQGVTMKSWVFLAKTCWGANVAGRLRLQMRYSTMSCPTVGPCTIADPPDYNKTNVPQIIFYAHYDDAFDNAVLKSYFPTIDPDTNTAPDNPYCGGQGSVYAEPLACRPAENEGDPCIVDKTFQVSNNGAEQTMIYLAIGGCEMQGLTSWNVSVESTTAVGAAEVCGARGTQQSFRCFSEAGGICSLQSALRITTQYVVPYKLSRAQIATIASCFVAAVTVGLVLIKVRQARIKRAKQRAVLDRMTKDFNHRGGANGVGAVNGNGNGLPPTSYTLGGRSAATPEAMTGHFSISGGMQR